MPQRWPSGVGAGLVMARLCIEPGSTLNLCNFFFTLKKCLSFFFLVYSRPLRTSIVIGV